MTEALNDAIAKFQQKWGKENNGNIRIFLQQPSHLPLLQVIDYVLWTVFRVYEKNDFRYKKNGVPSAARFPKKRTAWSRHSPTKDSMVNIPFFVRKVNRADLVVFESAEIQPKTPVSAS